MSRALDAGVKRGLQNGDHKQVYDAISQELSQTGTEYLEIEMLPSDYVLKDNVFFLKEGPTTIISKLRLVQAFIVARRILISHLDNPSSISAEEVQKATSVILLLDSEYATAAHTRKRLLLRDSLTEEDRRKELKKDLFFVNSLLSSRLHRHTKSPVLWCHKHWLLRQYIKAKMPMSLVDDLERVVYVAGEMHPRNYYAWTYARNLVSSQPQLNGGWDADKIQELTEKTERWCRIHYYDTSGWSFLLELAIKFPQHSEGIFRRTAAVAKSFSWCGEAVWNFLRNMIFVPAVEANPENRQLLVDLWNTLRQGAEAESMNATVLDRAAVWAKIPGAKTTAWPNGNEDQIITT